MLKFCHLSYLESHTEFYFLASTFTYQSATVCGCVICLKFVAYTLLQHLSYEKGILVLVALIIELKEWTIWQSFILMCFDSNPKMIAVTLESYLTNKYLEQV